MDKVLVLDFGGQYNQLIARRVRALSVYSEIKSFNRISMEEIRNVGYKGIIFTGGPNSVYNPNSPHYSKDILSLRIPILGICYGHQLLAYLAGGHIASAENNSEYGKTLLKIKGGKLLEGIKEESVCWMSHTDYVDNLPDGFKVTATTNNCSCAAMEDSTRNLYGVQFHPEVTHTEYGQKVLSNFIFNICKCEPNWKMGSFVKHTVEKYKKELAGKKVLLALSGGLDSSVVALLLHQAIGKNLVCVFVDHGLLRKDEGDYVYKLFTEKFDINLIRANAKERFLNELKGVTEPEAKRKIIGREFVEVFREEAKKIGNIDVLSQGTIYPDVIESGKDSSAVIKSHHNVGGLPKDIGFKEIVEPIRDLFKDEVREIGIELGLPKELTYRQPFPGPGLAVRIIGEITEEKIKLVQESDAILREEFKKHGVDKAANQFFTVLTDTHSVGVMGDARTYGYTLALRAVTTDDFMTATWTRVPYDVLEIISSRITNEIKGINRVVYDITSKPPATVEWE
jgi:GMP synthase (glutamine-hydrolysing)